MNTQTSPVTKVTNLTGTVDACSVPPVSCRFLNVLLCLPTISRTDHLAIGFAKQIRFEPAFKDRESVLSSKMPGEIVPKN